jgi:hypothetical protein
MPTTTGQRLLTALPAKASLSNALPTRGAATIDKTACSKAYDAATPMLSSNDKIQPSNHPADDPAVPTRFVFRTLSPRMIRREDSCRTTASTPTPCKMYRRRACSDVA